MHVNQKAIYQRLLPKKQPNFGKQVRARTKFLPQTNHMNVCQSNISTHKVYIPGNCCKMEPRKTNPNP